MEDEILKKLIKRKLPTDEKLQRVEIFVMKWQLPDIEKKCLNQIIENTEYPYKLVVYDTRKISIDKQGYLCGINTSKIWNTFIKESTCDYLCIMDSDAFTEPGWLTEIMKVFKKYPDAGVVAPISENGGVTPEQEIHRNETSIFKAPSHVSGYCFVFRKDIIADIGYFDEDFYYFGQDSDWCERIQESNKWNIYICPSAVVNHGDHREWSYSSRKLKETRKSVWSWETDRLYAQELAPKKKEERGLNSSHYPWGGIEYKKAFKNNEKK